ncbi:MAG: LamG domain-containing protein [Candidatus Pacebacteria bacterium]|nr:LamG domain-containing protein [Candidatus Paceibacterota bacterium]
MTPRRDISSVPTAFLAGTALALDATNATSTNATTTNLYVSGAVGVGTSTPITSMLAIKGDAAKTNIFEIASSTNANIFMVTGTGRVGIGTSSPYARLSVAGDIALTGGLYDSGASLGSNGMVLLSTGTGVDWVATSTLGISGGSGSLQSGYDGGATIETAAGTPVVITETVGLIPSTHDLLQLTANPGGGGDYTGDALQITMDAADANANTGNGLHIVVDQSQITGYPILIEDDAGVDLFAVAESGGVTVGSATARADVEIYGDLTTKGYKKALGISGIIDIFIYDTTKDSDSGRWRLSSNTDYQSWYTETKDDAIGDVCVPASDDRCGGSAFPSKAILVTTADSVYIFDANTNTMWMKFSQNASGYAIGVDTNNNPSGIGALNGTVYVGANGSSGAGVYAFDFTRDVMYNYDATDRSQGNKNIANRNTAVTYGTNNITTFAINNSIVNDVHVTVLSQSGAVAAGNGTLTGNTYVVAGTDSGASVINLGATRVIDYGDNLTDDVNQVWLTSRGRLYLTNEALSQVELYTGIDVDTADQNAPDDIYDEATGNQPNLAKTAPTFSTTPGALYVLERESFADSQNQLALGVVNSLPGGDVLYVGHNQGLSELHTVGIPSTSVLGWSKFYSTTGETGYMNGNHRAMFTMDGTSGDITDATIRNNVLEAKGSPTYRVNGVRGFGMSFNGTNQYACSDANNDATCDTDADFDPGLLGFTVELWFKHAVGTAGIDTLIDHSFNTTPGAAAGYRVWMDASGLIQARIDDDVTFGDEDPLSSPAGRSYADGQWHHLVFERVSTAYASPNAPMAVGIYLFIDGVRVAADNTIAATGSLNGSAILAIGADCSVGAACGTGANFWTGEIDDVYIAMTGVTTSDSPNAAAGAIARKYSEGRAAMLRPSMFAVDATAFSATTIGHSGLALIPNQFVGSIVEITGNTGVGQTRKIVSNDATTFTVTPAWTTAPDATSDFEVVPEQLYGSSNTVTSISITDTDPLNTFRTLFVGTNNGSDGGGVTALSGFGTPRVVDVYHADAGYTDNGGTAWSGTDADDIQAIATRSGITVLGSLGNLWTTKEDRILEQSIDQLVNNLATIRYELLADGLQGSALSAGGADLAELYSSEDELVAGEIVVVDPHEATGVLRSTEAYQKNVLGIVATRPGLVLGVEENATTTYPIALVGRVPVKVTTQNGVIRAGDRIAASPVAGYGMRATQAGRVLGTALEDMPIDDLLVCPGDSEDAPKRCGEVLVFVNLVDYSGMSVSLLAQEVGDTTTTETIPAACVDADGATTTPSSEGICEEDETLVPSYELSVVSETGPYELLEGLEILSFLKENGGTGLDSEIFTGRLSAGLDIITPRIFTDILSVGSIESSSDDGVVALMLGEDGRFEIRKKGDSEDPSATSSALVTFDAEGNAVFSGTISAQGLVFGGDAATHTATTSSPALFIASIEEGVADALAVIRSALVRSFAAVTLYAENMFASTITIIPEGRIAVPSGRDQISGTARIPSGSSSVDVENASILATSKIFITPLSVSEHPLVVTLKRPGIGFTVSLFAPAALDIYFDWLLVDSYPTDDTTTSVPGETVVEDIPIEETPVEEAPPDTPDEPEVEPPQAELEPETEPELVPEEEVEPVVEESQPELEAEVELAPEEPEPEPEEVEEEPEPEEENVEPEPEPTL